MRDPLRRREFHVRRTARDRYGIEGPLLGVRGDLAVADRAAIRQLAARMNTERAPGAPSVGAGEIVALGLIHELGHRLITRHDQTRQPGTMVAALGEVERRVGQDVARSLLDRFRTEFPGSGDDRSEPAHERLEELLLTRISNENPALGPLRELVDDRVLVDVVGYADAVRSAEQALTAGTGDGPVGDDDPTRAASASLLAMMRAPAQHAPTSLAGQLRYIREHWANLLGDDPDELMRSLDIALGVLAEQERAMHLRFGGGGGGGHGGHGGPGAPVEVPGLTGGIADEPESFSSDSAWMPRLVLMAKSTYVWLDQLSRRYGRDIRRLDAIPNEELDTLAGWGITGLWLIGLWQRSVASERIKQMRGNAEAVASAYSLDDYRIAADLGGEPAYADLRDRAWQRGIRLASDMVPNHMGIDSRWVIDHPEWFLSVPEPPYPAYTFNGADLSTDAHVGIVLEDHYWDDSDAAVVFKRFDRESGAARYIYHGNDGTSFPWNDTAQLDFLDPAVREHVIQVILDVARRFPVIRFDAAMVLAKRHIERLWWPQPGVGGGIPSRAEHALTKAEFDARMPVEFWREVVDRVAQEVPGTLLLAEAFWMLEGYFVRTLGMHRVYNSAFMHMLRDENGAGYRKVIKETIEFDPEILKRYVNFMSNPDEETAVEQFGKGDKYIGVAMVMATLPGLPMLGHGQVEGFAEKYGMEFRRAVRNEQPDPWLVERHRRELFPLFHRRGWFAEAHDFLLYDLVTADGSVDEQVFAYSNGSGPTRSLVLFHDRFGATAGTIRESAPYARKTSAGGRHLVRRTLAEGLGLSDDANAFVRYRDARSGLEYLRSCREWWERGLTVSLDAYQGHVFWEFQDLVDGSAGQWRRLSERLAGRGVPSLEAALHELQLEPVHAPLRAVFEGPLVASVQAGTADEASLTELEARIATFLERLAEATGVNGDAAAVATMVRERTAAAFAEPDPTLTRDDRAALLGWLALAPMGLLAAGADVARTSAAWFDELGLATVLAAGFRSAGFDEAAAWRIAGNVRLLLALPRPSQLPPGRAPDRRLLVRWLEVGPVREALGINTWQGVEWLDHDRLLGVVGWALRLDTIETGAPPDSGLGDRLTAIAERAGYRVDRLASAATRSAAPRRPSAATTSGGGSPTRSRQSTRPRGDR